MAMDSDSAFGGPSGSKWTQGFQSGARLTSRQTQISPSSLETTSGAGPQTDRLPFGLSPYNTNPYSASQAQSIPLSQSQMEVRSLASAASVDAALSRTREQVRHLLIDQTTPLRLASHLSVLAVAALILILSQIDIPTWEVSLRILPSNLQSSATTAGSRVSAFTNGQVTAPLLGQDSLQRSAIPFTIVHEDPQQGLLSYTVQPGDTVLGIAQKFGLQPESVQWSNPALEQHVDLIRPGDQLVIPPLDGAVHTVAAGDTLSSLASRYKVEMEDIIAFAANGLTDATAGLTVGQQIVIPGGTRPYIQQQAPVYAIASVPASAKMGSGAFIWPASGPIGQGYWSGHPALDISGWIGAPVKSADAGYVAVAASGWNGGYGNHVIIDHGNGFSTLYAHLNSIYVRAGENVARGTDIGSLGSTGNSTGPHLHIEIRYQGVPRNPMGYLP